MNDLWYLLIEITKKCNAGCEHCGSRCNLSGEDILTKEDILALMMDIKANIGTDIMVNISGGEPLMRKDLFEIMGEVSKLGFDWGMVSNGVLITDEVIQKMKKAGMKTITISIDGVGETHNRLRHLPGAYNKILQNLSRLKKARFLDHLQVTFTSNHKNVREFPMLYRELCKIGVDSIRTSFVDPIGRAQDHKELYLNRRELNYMIDFVNLANKKGKVPITWGCCHYLGNRIKGRTFECLAGIHAASILCNGDIYVCTSVPRRVELVQGNIKTDSFSQVWDKGFQFARNRKLDYCQGCKYLSECKGDSLHTWDFENNKPKFCYKRVFDLQNKEFEQYLKTKYPSLRRTEIGTDNVEARIYMEPSAYKELKIFFHMGENNPLSMFEQQMGLVGFRIDNDYVIKYAFPTHIIAKDERTAYFNQQVLQDALTQAQVVLKNYDKSDDREDYVGQGLQFLGFAHSHPNQEELIYSLGDEKIHRKLQKKFGDYIGILVNPAGNTIGAYYGQKIKQGTLVLLEVE